MPTVEENSATLALAARYGKLNAETWQKATQIEFGMADLLNFLEARRAVPAQASVDVEKLQADLDWHKASLAAHAGKLTSVWDGIREAVAKYSGKPCEGEPFDRLDELLRSMTSAQASAPAAVDTEVLHALLEKIHGTHNQAVNLAYCPSSEPFKAADRAFREAYRVLFEVIDALAAQSPSQGEMDAGAGVASSEALYAIVCDDKDMNATFVVGEEAARAAFERIGKKGYNAHLFGKIASNSRDDPYYSRNIAPTPPAPQEVEQARDAVNQTVDRIALTGALQGAELALDGTGRDWVLRRDGANIRYLDQFERDFVFSAIAASLAAMAAQPDDSGSQGNG